MATMSAKDIPQGGKLKKLIIQYAIKHQNIPKPPPPQECPLNGKALIKKTYQASPIIF
jgi:hypothetical protein